MTEERQRTCEERLPEHLGGRLEDIRDLNERMDSEDWEEADAAATEAGEYGLALDVTRTLRWELSTGGPADWVEFHIDSDDDVVRIEYVFQDWFDGARREVTGEDRDALVDFYERVFRGYVECG